MSALENFVMGIAYMIFTLACLFVGAAAMALIIMIVGYVLGFWKLAFDGWMLIAIPIVR
jgi:hypothetical protein